MTENVSICLSSTNMEPAPQTNFTAYRKNKRNLAEGCGFWINVGDQDSHTAAFTPCRGTLDLDCRVSQIRAPLTASDCLLFFDSRLFPIFSCVHVRMRPVH